MIFKKTAWVYAWAGVNTSRRMQVHMYMRLRGPQYCVVVENALLDVAHRAFLCRTVAGRDFLPLNVDRSVNGIKFETHVFKMISSNLYSLLYIFSFDGTLLTRWLNFISCHFKLCHHTF
jgi:hypothetical protein